MKKQKPIDEAKIWRKFRKGDRKAFAVIFNQYMPLLHHYGIKFFHNETLVEDSIQDLFLELWRTRESLAEVSSVKYYLIVSFRRILLKKLKNSQKQGVVHDHATDNLPEYEESFEALLIRLQTEEGFQSSLSKAIDGLSSRQREAIRLKFFQQKSYQEITSIMGINYQTARKFIYKALSNLRKTLHQETLAK